MCVRSLRWTGLLASCTATCLGPRARSIILRGPIELAPMAKESRSPQHFFDGESLEIIVVLQTCLAVELCRVPAGEVARSKSNIRFSLILLAWRA